MAKKRKLRSSEPQPQSQSDPPPASEPSQQQEQDQEKPQIESQQEQMELQQEQRNGEELEKQPPVEEKDREKAENMEEDDKENEEQEDPEGEKAENANLSVDGVAEEKDLLEANGCGGDAEGGDDEVEDQLEEEPVEKLLEPFSKEQLVVLLKEAVSKYPDFNENVQQLADAEPAHRKIFVHGMGWDTNAESLISVFGKYGEIEDCKAVCDKVSGKSKGYGFILFKHRSGARKALKQPQKMIGNRMTSCQLASAGPVPAPSPTTPLVSEYTQRKIFVSNVSPEIDPQKLLEFFSKYGEIEEGPLGLDKQTGKPKGFALFVYKTIESAKKALEQPHQNFQGHTLHVQRAVDGPKQHKQYYQHHQHQQHQHQQYHNHPSKKGKYFSVSASGSGHLMAPSRPAVGFNAAVPAPALTPALGQALTALFTQGAGMGITNLLGGLGAPMNPGVLPALNNAGYGNQGGGAYGNQPGMQGGYQNPQIGQGSARPQQGGAPYTGHGH